ncbi:MAG: adenine phosphoribosyltransferase [Bacteroidota bacterium]
MNGLEQQIRNAIRDVPDFPKPGILFKDITPVLQDPRLCDSIAKAICDHFASRSIDAVVGIESRGFLFGMLVAQKLGVPFVPVRKKGKLPAKTLSHEYALEYGSAAIEVHEDALPKGARVLIHDDLLATGGTADAAAVLVSRLGAETAGFAFLVGLNFLPGKDVIRRHATDILTLVDY